MKLIALPDLHGKLMSYLARLAPHIAEVDVVLLPGDLTAGLSGTSIETLINGLRSITDSILTVPGNWEHDTTIAYLDAQNVNLHRQHRIIDEVVFYGVGGALPFIGYMELSEGELAACARDAVATVPDGLPEIFVCHQPPINTRNDLNFRDAHVGSHAVRAFIEQRQPLICFTGHIHEGTGLDTIGTTQIINPGPIWQSESYAYAEIDGVTVKTLEIRKL